MAEAVRPETEATVQQFSSAHLNYKNFERAFRSLISLNLIVVKPEADAPDLYDLHPLVRQFVRTKFVRSERSTIIQIVINQYKLIIGSIESLLGVNLPFGMLERWSQKAELEVSAGLYDEAFETLSEVRDAFIGGGHLQEYVRASRLLFEAIDWETAPTKYQQFDNLVGMVVAALDQLGEFEDSDSLIDRYRTTIPNKTARYIKLCDILAYSRWMRGEFQSALDWATEGVALKTGSDVDTEFDCKHTLALAQRDAGDPAAAMENFLIDCTLEDLLTGAEGVTSNGSMYGNVGRCLQLLGRQDEALTCLKRSASILEHDTSLHSKSNRAYARRWIGQIFASLGDKQKAEAFFVDAIRVLGSSAPIRVREIIAEIKGLAPDDSLVMAEGQATRIVDAWMRAQ
jgi:tetratricopeptide (TPR) repeat protein